MTKLSIATAIAEADRCVKCGLCLAQCPTYQLHHDENESPRGRIALAEALLKGQLPGDQAALGHINRCLLCQRCTKVCPSQVSYADLLDVVRQQWPQTHWTTRLAQHTTVLSVLNQVARWLPNWRGMPTSIRLAQALGTQRPAPKPGVYPASGKTRGRVGLFLGCATRAAQGQALQASLCLLNQLGYEVVVPKNQGCCGALAQHQGESDNAELLATKNVVAFGSDLDAIVTTASGCAAHWHTQNPFTVPAQDILLFLAQAPGWDALHYQPLDKTVALQQPCSLVNVLDGSELVRQLLQKIPQMTLHTIGQAGGCCGAAGNHLLQQRQQACALRQPLLDALQQSQADYLLSTNVGCALHLAEGIQYQQLPVTTLHPVELLAQQLVGQ